MKIQTPGRRGWIVAIVVGGISLALPYIFHPKHYGSWWESIPGWWAWFGGIGCAAIVVVSKWLGSIFLSKREDWYE